MDDFGHRENKKFVINDIFVAVVSGVGSLFLETGEFESMRWDIKYADDGSMVRINVVGKADIEDYRISIQELVSHPMWRINIPSIVDLRNYEFSEAGSSFMVSLAQGHRDVFKGRKVGPVAMIVSRTVEYGFSRIWEAYAHDIYSASDVFYTEEEALEWLQHHSAGALGF